MQVNIQVTGINELKREFADFSERRLKAALATALTRTAVQVRARSVVALQSSIDAPTPYTIRQLRYVAASADRLVSAVGFNIAPIQDIFGNVVRYQDLGAGATPAGKYLDAQISGGPRRNKRFEVALRARGILPTGWFAVPGERAKIDNYGNQSVGELRQILSWFNAAEMTAGSTQNMTEATRAKRRKGTKKTAGFEYFFAPVGGTRTFARSNGKVGTHKLTPGIYKRTSLGLGSRIEPILIFVSGTNYRAKFDFIGQAQQEADKLLPTEIRRALNESLARLKAK